MEKMLIRMTNHRGSAHVMSHSPPPSNTGSSCCLADLMLLDPTRQADVQELSNSLHVLPRWDLNTKTVLAACLRGQTHEETIMCVWKTSLCVMKMIILLCYIDRQRGRQIDIPMLGKYPS